LSFSPLWLKIANSWLVGRRSTPLRAKATCNHQGCPCSLAIVPSWVLRRVDSVEEGWTSTTPAGPVCKRLLAVFPYRGTLHFRFKSQQFEIRSIYGLEARTVELEALKLKLTCEFWGTRSWTFCSLIWRGDSDINATRSWQQWMVVFHS
jgi:hypothetical protein